MNITHRCKVAVIWPYLTVMVSVIKDNAAGTVCCPFPARFRSISSEWYTRHVINFRRSVLYLEPIKCSTRRVE